MNPPFIIERNAQTPIAAAAIHDGHALRPDVAAAIALTDAERLREEDPFTARWTSVAGTRLIGCRSRFEVDLNRPRDKAVYRVPADAWGLEVWRTEPPDELVRESLAIHDAFYAAAYDVLDVLRARHGLFAVLDLHSYNYRRDGPNAPPADPARNPEVNVGTGSMDRRRWAPLVERFMDELAQADCGGRRLDVRENVRFRGGHFSAWVHSTFPDAGCALAIEVRKFFMDEWTGIPDDARIAAIGGALASTVPGLIESLRTLA